MKNINNNTLFRYLFNLDNRNLPDSILRWMESIDNQMYDERREAIENLKLLRGNCRNLVVFSKTFVKALDRSYKNFTQFHKELLNELDGENGVSRSPYFVDDSYVVYSINNGCVNLWVFYENVAPHISIPGYHICASPNDELEYKDHKMDCYIISMVDGLMDVNLRDYLDMVLDYLCLRQWAEVELGKISTTVQKQIKKANKTKIVTENGVDYYLFDCKWYTEICNNNSFQVRGHFRLQPYSDGSKKLIWINEFTKHGYHRKATIDKVKDGDIILN
jgi:hypothetical protein